MQEFTSEQIVEFRRIASDGMKSGYPRCSERAAYLADLLAKFRNDRKVGGRSKAAVEIEELARWIESSLKYRG
jgi:hypothetical protein